MRAAFTRTLAELADQDERIVLLTADLGFMALEPFSERFPGRFFNVGVAEQNMVGVATGLAEAGFLPFAYSIATFASLRPYEFFRNGPIAHRFPVRLIGMGGGFEYGSAGFTHHGLEDVGAMRLQPDLTIVAPADHRQARAALQATWDLPGPIYYRLGKDDKTVIPHLEGEFELGRGQLVRDGTDLVMVAMGSVAAETWAAAVEMEHRGISCAVMIVASVSPTPVDDMLRVLRRFPLAITVEAHSVVGGIGSLVAEIIAETPLPARLIRCGVTKISNGRSGSQHYMHHMHGLSPNCVADVATRALMGL